LLPCGCTCPRSPNIWPSNVDTATQSIASAFSWTN
jgi:hypothetical protein